MSQQKICTKRTIDYKKQSLEHKYVLQESCKTVRRWQRSILLGNGGHCVGDCVRWWNTCHNSRTNEQRKDAHDSIYLFTVCNFNVVECSLWLFSRLIALCLNACISDL